MNLVYVAAARHVLSTLLLEYSIRYTKCVKMYT